MEPKKKGSGALRRALPIRDITPKAVQERLSFRLQHLIGPGKRMTLQEAAVATGISPRTLKAYVEGRACPNLARYGRMLRVLGPEVGIELAMMIGWEPRAANPILPHTEDIRAVRDAIAQTIRALDMVLQNDLNAAASAGETAAPPRAASGAWSRSG
jgi:hypothetical protein